MAAALNHSANKKSLLKQEVVEGTHSARQGQKTAAGTRPAPLAEVAEPKGLSAAPRCPDAGVPLLSVPLFAGRDGIDDTTVRWLLKLALRQRQKEEVDMEEKKGKEHASELRRRAQALLDHAASLPKRKRKKKRKRKLPRNSSCPRLAARHLGRYGPEGHFCRRCPRCTHVETWTFYEPLVSGTLFGACLAGGAQDNFGFL